MLPRVFILTSLTKGRGGTNERDRFYTIVRKCLSIVYRALRSVIHSHTTITVDSIMFERDRRERDRAAVTAVRLESTYGARIISGAGNLFNVNVFNFPFVLY